MGQNQGRLKTALIRTDGAFRLLTALPEGAASWYATFGPIAVFYQNGMWLLAPVAGGAAISITDEALNLLHERYPENRFINALHNGAVFLNQGIGGFMADFGFMWSMMITTGVFIQGDDYADNQFASFYAPLIAFVPAILTRLVTYRLYHNESVPRLMRYAGFFSRGASAPSEVLGALAQQGILSPNSFIPPAVTAGTALLGLSAAVLQDCTPNVSKGLLMLLILAAENPSLATLIFNLPNDIFAALNGDEINPAFFFSTAGFTAIFLLLLTCTTLARPFIDDEEENETAEYDDIESSHSNDDEEEHSDDERNSLLQSKY